MRQHFFKPQYFTDFIKFGETSVTLEEIKQYLFIDLLTNKEIADILSEKTGGLIKGPAITKLCKYYNIIIDAETKKKKALKRAQKTASNLQQKYGVSNVFQLQDIKDKAASTKLARYNNSNYVNSEQAKQTCLDKYGVSNYSSTTDCRAKVVSTNLQKYGTETPAQNKDILNKMKQTCLVKYGVDNYWKSDAFKNEMQQLYFNKFPELSSEYKEIYHDTNKLKDYIMTLTDRTVIGIAKSFNISRDSAYALLYKHDLLDFVDVRKQTSSYEREIAEYIGLDLCVLNDRTVFSGKELDIYVPTRKLGIEINGTYWHSALFKAKNYHLDKSKLAEQHGIRLIHIYEYEWLDPKQQHKIKLLLDIALGRVKTKIYARDCTIKQISNVEAKPLNEAVHLQGHRNAQITYGLFYNNELVQLMSFSKTRYNRNIKDNNTWEIIRGCPGSNNIVVGGVSKLFTHFVKDYNPTAIFSYCDFNKFNGISYETLGMQFIGYTGPDMKWILSDGSVVNRNPKKHSEIKAFAKTQIFGAGSKKYLWKAEDSK